MPNKKGCGGAGRNQGRKSKWYGKTVAMRIPECWVKQLKHCMDNEITPIFDNVQEQDDSVHNKVDKVHKQNEIVQNQLDNVHKGRYVNHWDDSMIKLALKLEKENLNGGQIWLRLKDAGYKKLPSRNHMKVTLKRWAKIYE